MYSQIGGGANRMSFGLWGFKTSCEISFLRFSVYSFRGMCCSCPGRTASLAPKKMVYGGGGAAVSDVRNAASG
jgi:hypothetical protein